MRRLCAIALFCFIASTAYAQTPAKLQGWCQTGNQAVSVPGGAGPSANKYQRSYPSCTVTVFDAGTVNMSTIYSDSSSTPQANPFTASVAGIWSFYAMDGKYDVRFSGAGIASPFTMGNFPIYNNSGGKGPWSINPGTLTTSTINSATFKINMTDNSPPSGPAGVINTYYIPDLGRWTLNTGTSGQHVGANGGLLIEQGSTGNTYTTTTQGITGGVASQSVSVASSAVFETSPGLICATIDPGKTAGECVTVLTIPDATHITAVFANNHTNGAVIGQRYSGAQHTLAITGNDVLTDGTGTPGNNDIFPLNIGVQCKNATFHECPGVEIDVINNSGVDANYVGSGNTPVTYGGTIVSTGSNHNSFGWNILGGSSSSRFKTGLQVGGAKDNALVVSNNGAGTVTNGLNVVASATNGIIVGSNQAVPTDPGFAGVDPTNGIYLTAKDPTRAAVAAASNTLCLEERVTSTNHPWCLQADGAGDLTLGRDGSYTFIGWVGASGVSTARSFIATSAADDTSSKIYVTDMAGTTVTAKMTSLGEVMGTTFATRQQCNSPAGTCVNYPRGHVSIAAGATTVTVATTRVAKNMNSTSTIIVTENSSLGTLLGVTCNTTISRTYAITAMTDATSFVITASGAPAANPACLSYMIIN